ncbi:MAG: hypothetical protein MI976_17010 [Pseudomonadales bacterium]|nr:hypothetical protein [Pseudomonadales bacterium]
MSLQLLEQNSRYFSSKLPPELELELNRLTYNEKSIAEGLESQLVDINDRWPNYVDTYIALFKYYFRTAQYRQAEVTVWQAMKLTSNRGEFRRNYRVLSPDSQDWLAGDSDQRHYLFCLKALGVIRLRRGRVCLAKKVLTKLEELDPYDEIGGGNYLLIANSI